MLECWLGEERLEKSNCICGAVSGAVINGCATCGGADVGSSIVDGDHGRAMVSIAIVVGAIEGQTTISPFKHQCLIGTD